MCKSGLGEGVWKRTVVIQQCAGHPSYTYDSVSDPSHKSAELKDISEVVTGNGGVEKICQSMISESDNVLIDESNQLLELKEIFMNDKEPVSFLMESFLNNTYLDNTSKKTQQRFIENNMTYLLSEFLSTSDKVTGISSNNILNESNVQGLMQDYSFNHSDPNYQSTSFMRNLLNSYLG